ncbi:ErfK/YbiS/YcfS/YnhG family protein [Rippkaea orientalis PCC 8801]|uniref:ErfK/YbiS/YcfS/YnhG family protein n=1 Tax=Rippkaea orientalis (strain PCC 8801 / RF-1) TaxID=41431 RepID=B7JVI1_RIPO1|nr:L,D-transpeptidase [Rippkaea orientalis]ACK68314.1 ErfK/YbiS/YcfS/YnhG family protein [Rippkaea orientalis PCC 8801]
MKVNQSLLSLGLAFCAGIVPSSLTHRQAIAQEVSQPVITETPATTTPALPSEVPPAKTPAPAPAKVKATRLVLNLKQRKVYAYQNDKVLASYPVAIGKKGWETPKGNFTVTSLIVNPKWKNPWTGKVSAPGPNSPLGERWIGFATKGKDVIGFHGTPGEHVMGQAVSHGCVRMRNKDIKALFELVDKGTPVIVQ